MTVIVADNACSCRPKCLKSLVRNLLPCNVLEVGGVSGYYGVYVKKDGTVYMNALPLGFFEGAVLKLIGRGEPIPISFKTRPLPVAVYVTGRALSFQPL